MAHGDAASVAQHWADQMNAAQTRISQGIDATRVAPGQLAARQQQAYLTGVQQSAAKWARNVAAVPLAAWQQAMKEKGLARIGTGATAAVDKMTTFMGKLLTYVDSNKGSLPPRGTYDQNKARMNQWADIMHKFSK